MVAAQGQPRSGEYVVLAGDRFIVCRLPERHGRLRAVLEVELPERAGVRFSTISIKITVTTT